MAKRQVPLRVKTVASGTDVVCLETKYKGEADFIAYEVPGYSKYDITISVHHNPQQHWDKKVYYTTNPEDVKIR